MLKTMEKVLFILGELDDDDLDWMLKVGQHERFAVGHVLIREQQPIDALYILLDGELSVSTLATGGHEIATLSSGEVVGEMSFVDTRPPSATVTAKRTSLVLAVPRDLLVTKLQQDVAFASRFYRALAVFLSTRLRETASHLGNVPMDAPAQDLTQEARDSFALAQTRLDWLLRRIRDK
jgi:CRP/FNR family transcriptional regulator, cyclic AMP receptor protein